MAKWITLVVIIVILSVWHLHSSHLKLESHILHQELFFIPIILASFWYRLKGGLGASLFISTIYITSMLPHMDNQNVTITVFIQVGLYVMVAVLLGWLTHKLHVHQEHFVRAEQWRSLRRLTSALSLEIQEIVNGLEVKYSALRNPESSTTRLDFDEEIDKLKRLTTAFNRIESPDNEDILSVNINEIVKKIVNKCDNKAKQAGVKIITNLDKAGCPSMVVAEGIVQIIEDLVINAIEASPQGSKVNIITIRKGAHCVVEVTDHGPGVDPNNVNKLFTPFFSTKSDGHGLSLAVGKKVMVACEGDLRYRPGADGGSVFTLIIPRENMDQNINEYMSERT